MTSTMVVTDLTDDKEVAAFKLPVKAVFGRMFCNTDGSIGYPTELTPAQMFAALEACLGVMHKLTDDEMDSLDDLRSLAHCGHSFLIDWVH